MCVTRALLRSVVVLLLLANSSGKRRCNYKEILGSYREVIFVELQNLNLTDYSNSSKERSHCPSVKAHHILSSIYGMTQRMRCQIGAKQSAFNKPLESMEQVIIHNCRPDHLGERVSCSAVKKIQGKKKKRISFIRMIKTLIICWQKLQTVLL